MAHRLLALSLALLLAACAGGAGPTPPTTPGPTTPGGAASPSPLTTVSPSLLTPTDSPPSPGGTSVVVTLSPGAGATWSSRADVAAGPGAREDHTWTVDADGAVAYLFGGRSAGAASDELWAFDLATDSWTIVQPAGEGPQARWGHTATWVPGVGLVVWSGQSRAGFFADIWAFDPLTGAWRELPALGAIPEARYGSCASLGPDGELWISHGFTEDAGRFSDTRSYEFASGLWTNMTPLEQVPVERCLHDCYWAADGRLVLYAGQTTGTPALDDIWAYDPASGTWSPGPDQPAAARQLYSLAVHGEEAFVFGGGTLDGGYLDDTWTIDPATLGLQPVEPAGSPPPARAGGTLISDQARSRLLLFGGTNDEGELADLWELALAE